MPRYSLAKYEPLRRRLLAAKADSLELSFDEIGRLVGGLPASARIAPRLVGK